MPTLLTVFGMRFFFYLDEHQPIHVHVDCNGKKAKIALEPTVCLVYNHGLKEQELKKAIETCAIYRDDFIAECLAYLCYAKRNLHTTAFLDVEEIDENTLSRLRAQIQQRSVLVN